MSDPIPLFLAWYEEAVSRCKQPEAAYLATASTDGAPSLRTVLYRGLSQHAPRFFTNYQSRKGLELLSNPKAALLFYWEPLERQVRFEGVVEALTPEESDAYFRERPRGHQLSAWASPQSERIEGRQVLLEIREALERRFAGQEVPRPPHGAAFAWCPRRSSSGRKKPDRFHQRRLFFRTQHSWEETTLAP